jgi:hypothetical protein
MSTQAYPLAWPSAWPRTPAHQRRRAKFGHQETGSYTNGGTWRATMRGVSVADGTKRVQRALQRMGVMLSDITISTNIELRRDGLPYSNRRVPEDPGVAVYWSLDSDKQCMAVDIYGDVGENLAAIAAAIDALRAIERHGGAQILKRAFLGMKALPASTQPVMTTTQAAERIASHAGGMPSLILDNVSEAKERTRVAVARVHPDRHDGSQTEAFLLVNEAKRVLGIHHRVKL